MLYLIYTPDKDNPIGELDLDLNDDDDVILNSLINAGYLHGDAEDFEIDDHVNGALEGIIITLFEDDTEVLEVLTEIEDDE